MNGELLVSLQHSIDYIEENIDSSITIDEICKNSFISKYHFQRVFKAITDRNIIEYVRARRLTKSLDELINTNSTIKNVALKSGFEYEQSYTRAFKAEFGLSPQKFREKPVPAAITPEYNINFIKELENSMIIKPRFIYKPEFIICGILHKITVRDNAKKAAATSAAIDFFYNTKQLIQNQVNPNVYLGYSDWSCLDKHYSYYITGTEVTSCSAESSPFCFKSVPESKYTVFKFIGFFKPENIKGGKHLEEIYRFMDDYFLANRNLRRNHIFTIEYVDISKCSDKYCELDLYVPVL